METEKNEAVIRRIRKLLALASDSNAPEAKVAYQTALKLLAENALSIEEIKTTAKDNATGNYAEEQLSDKALPWMRVLIANLANFCSVTTFYRGTVKSQQFIFGAETNREVFKQLLNGILEQVDRLVENIKKSTVYEMIPSRGQRKSWLADYKFSLIHAITNTLNQIRRHEESSSTALVLAKTQLTTEVNKRYPDMRTGKAEHSRPLNAYGYKDGKTVEIFRPVA